MANKFLGQHFLKNATVIKNIIAALALEENETIFEIGPGHGELTLTLAKAAQEKNCRIIAIEKDETLAAELQKKIEEAGGAKNVEIIHGDALKTNFERGAAYKLAGNIPYYITGHFLRIVSELKRKPALAVLMVQKEVAERLTARPPEMNRLAASVQFWSDAEIICGVPKEDFAPVPQVDSAVIALRLKHESKIKNETYYKAVRAIFSQPRKMLINNLATLGEKKTIEKILQELNVDPSARPQNLAIEEIEKIAERITE